MGSSSDERRAFLEAKKREILARALMSYPESSPLEVAEVTAWARLFDVLDAPMVIRHPHVDVRVELSALLGPRISYLISIGDYELSDLILMQRWVREGDKVLELGGGAGLTAALDAKLSKNEVVVAEPDQRLFPLIQRQVELNGGTVKFEHGAVLAKASSPTIDFWLDEEIWFSSTKEAVAAHGERTRIKATVPVLALSDLLDRHRPTVVMVDVEGAELEMFDAPLAHKPRVIAIEIHAPHFGETNAAHVVQAIVEQGYRFVDQLGWTYVFERRS